MLEEFVTSIERKELIVRISVLRDLGHLENTGAQGDQAENE